MITIALDEQGDFENLEGKRESLPVFIGGIIYDDLETANDYDNEKIRLQKYFKNLCSSVGCNYPQDLHYTSTGNNEYKVAKVKAQFCWTIKEFLEKGIWNSIPIVSEPRRGRYHIFALLRGEDGKKNLLSSDVSEAVKDDFASNLYVHMAEEVVERLIFHNPILRDIQKVRLELATRRVILSGNDRTEQMKQYETLGLKAVQRENGSNPGVTEYLLTNPDNYRTAVEREMLNCGQNKILINRIGVKSIYYQNQRAGMDFLYLSDAICSLLGYKLQGNKPSIWINQFDKRICDINSKADNIIWAYDENDDFFTRAWKYYEEGDYYRSLSLAFDGSKYRSDMTSFYIKKWFGIIRERITKKDDSSGFSMAVKKYKESILNNNLNQEKLVYIFNCLETMASRLNFSNNKEEAELFDLYDSGVSVFIHNGKLEEAEHCFEKTKQYAEYVTTEKYLRTRNKMVVFLCDNLEFDRALMIADENVKYHELLSDMKREMFGTAFSESLNHAIAISQRAQVLAFLNDEKAEQDFAAALKIMDEGTPDRYITQSYLMHYYICNNNKDKFEKLAFEYFGNKTSLIEQFNYISKEGAKEKNAKFSLKYAMYVYVKALYVFYHNDLPDKLVNKLRNIEKSLMDINNKAAKQINGHPWELIYKYLCLIMKNYNYENEANFYRKSLEEMFRDSEGLIRNIAIDSQRSIEENSELSRYTYMYY